VRLRELPLFGVGSVTSPAPSPIIMFHKRARLDPTLQNADPGARMRANLADLFLSGDVSGDRFQTVVNDVTAAGARGVEDLAGKPPGPHTARDIRRRLLKSKSKEWPKLYEASVRTWSTTHQCMTVSKVSFLLPHEVIAQLVPRGDLEKLLTQDGLCAPSRQHLHEASAELGLPSAMPIGLWVDGMPCNSDRTESVEAISMYFPGRKGWDKTFCFCSFVKIR
jgi:hypothetical protein